MRGRIRPLSVAALLLTGSCGDTGSQTPSGEVRGLIDGRVTLEGPALGVSLIARDGASAVDTIFARSSADEQGRFRLDLGPLYGPLVLEAQTGAGERLETWATLPQGGSLRDVQLSPVTTLATAWARGAVMRGQDRDAAWTRGTELVFGHLGGARFATVAGADLRAEEVAAVDAAVEVGLIHHALAEQARRYGQRSAGQGGAPVTLMGLVEAYARDLEDGLADGRDRFGAPVVVGQVPLTVDSLRLDLSVALGAFLDGPWNMSGLGSGAVQDLLRQLRESDSPLFPEGSLAARDQVGPAVALVWRRGGAPVEPGQPVTGAVVLEVTATDRSGVASVRGTLLGPATVRLGEVEWPDRVTWPVDTTALPDGAYQTTVEAVDGLGLISTTTAALLVDHTPPTVSLSAPAVVATPTVSVSGRWFDTSGVAQVSLHVNGELRVVLDAPAASFSATVPLGCAGGESVVVEAITTDRAGNVSAPAAATVRCQGTAPSLVWLRSSVVDERAAVFEHGPDGALLRVRFPPSPPAVVLEEHSVWPVRLFKLFSRLHVGAENLPVLEGRAAGLAPLMARFRTFVDGALSRDWAPLPVAPGGRLSLPIARDTFGEALLEAGPDAVHGAEIEVTDGQGGRVAREVSVRMTVLSSPVWVGACQATASPSEVRRGFEQTTVISLESARVVWDLGAASFAPPVRVAWPPLRASTWISAVGEDTWRAPDFTAADALPFAVRFGRCNANALPAGTTHVQDLLTGPGAGVCLPGLYPDERRLAFLSSRDGALSVPAGLGAAVEVTRARVPAPTDSRGRVLLDAGTAYDVDVQILQPVLRLPDSGPYTWPATVQVPTGYSASVQAQGRARYPSARLERSGVDYRLSDSAGRPWVTRLFVERVAIQPPPLGAEAVISEWGIEVPVVIEAACSAPSVVEVQL